MTESRNLQDLPPDLFRNLAAFLDKKDMKSLRHVSRSCDSKIFEPFTTAYFRNLRVFLFPQPHKRTIFPSMKIVKHPGFGKAVRCIEVVLSGFQHGLTTYQPQWQFLLGILFKDLKQNPGPHSICIKINGTFTDRRFQPIVINSLHTLLKAITAADLSFNEFDISRVFQRSYTFDGNVTNHPHDHWPDGPRHQLTYDLLPTFAEAMNRTQYLKASFQEDAKSSQGYEGFVSALASLPALKTLHLSVKVEADAPGRDRRGRPLPYLEKFEDKELASIVMQKVFPVLEQIAFNGVSIRTRDLLRFVNKQPKLKSLELYQAELLGLKDVLSVDCRRG